MIANLYDGADWENILFIILNYININIYYIEVNSSPWSFSLYWLFTIFDIFGRVWEVGFRKFSNLARIILN